MQIFIKQSTKIINAHIHVLCLGDCPKTSCPLTVTYNHRLLIDFQSEVILFSE